MKRSSAILLPISSLPSPYGIGSLGRAAGDFIDFLHDAGQSWWQILPVGHTGCGDSPYQCMSAYAGNPYFVDLDLLIEDGLLTKAEVDAQPWGGNPGRVDYGVLYERRYPLLAKAAERGRARDGAAVDAFVRENEWLPDYALFMALKRHFGMRAWHEWPDEGARLRKPEAVQRFRALLADDVWLFTYIQFLFFKQWDALRAYAHSRGVGIIGDLPIYVALDSADVWASPESFQLDEKNLPAAVAGVPPDYFSEDGQLWGNPLYDYERMEQDGFGWWIRRVGGAQKLYDVIRIDHFRGFERYWAVPFVEKTAKNGRWIEGPGMKLVGALSGWFPNLAFIAEDLGVSTPGLRQLMRECGFPGMKVLEFAFTSGEESDFLPHTYQAHCVCYTGTHDNAPLRQWLDEAPPEDLDMATQYLGLNAEEGLHWGMIRGGMSSVAELFVAQMQDYLGLGAQARMNIPGVPDGNWQWRLLPGQLTPALARRIAEMTTLFGRAPKD